MTKKDLVKSLISKMEDLLVEAENLDIRSDLEEEIFFKINPYMKKNNIEKKSISLLMCQPVQEKLLGKGLLT
tara:strand:- start:202 stop:417 length:216 start_codon:yes stop_codon:yes gene_type:complete